MTKKRTYVKLSPVVNKMLKELSDSAHQIIDALMYNEMPFRALYAEYCEASRELARTMKGAGPYVGVSTMFYEGILATYENSDYVRPINNHKELLALTEFQRWLDGRQQTYKVDAELAEYLSEDIKDLSIDEKQDEKTSAYMTKCMRLFEIGHKLSIKAKEGCEDSKKRLDFVHKNVGESYQSFISGDVWGLPFPENFEFVNSEPFVFAFEDGMVFVAPIIRPNAKTIPLERAGLYWDEFPEKWNKSTIQRMFRSHSGRAYALFHNQDAFYLTFSIFKKPNSDNWRLTIAHIAPHKSDNTANPYRVLLAGRLITALNCKKTIVKKERSMFRGRRNKNKASRISPSISTIRVDGETLERVRTVNFSDSGAGGHTLPRGERCATKSKQWVLEKNLEDGEVVIASRTNTSGNKVFLVKRDRRKVYYNQHLKEEDKTPQITRMKLWDEQRRANKRDRTPTK